MSFSDKIDEWIKEAETRPASALMVLKLVANRLRDLSERNEELLAENLALQDGTRVEEYQKRITHLEYQLDLLKRRLGADENALAELSAQAQAISVLVYDVRGRILRLEASPADLVGPALGRIAGELTVDGEFPRLLVVPSQEEVLLLFTSGRINTLPVTQIPAVTLGGAWDWGSVPQPDEPHAGELLVCLMPLSRLSLADYFLQASRRGSVKKTLTTLAQSILGNRYLGKGTNQKADQAYDALLGQKKDRYALVTYEGRLLGLETDDLAFSAEERIRLEATDHVIAAFIMRPDETLLCVTQNGKVVQRDIKAIELTRSPTSRGQALIPPSRLDQGTRFVGAVTLKDVDKVIVLDAEGQLTVHLARDVAGAGAIHAGAMLLAIGVIPASA